MTAILQSKMADQEQNLCLLQLPLLVIQKILSNVHNRTNVSRTCKCVYEIVCDMEVQRHVICLNAYQTAGDGIVSKTLNFINVTSLTNCYVSFHSIQQSTMMLFLIQS